MRIYRCDRCGFTTQHAIFGRVHPPCGGAFSSFEVPPVELPAADVAPDTVPDAHRATRACACGTENPYPQDGGNQPNGTWRCYACRHDPVRKYRFR